MSDNTANAREPSMEDILASIRRIIDEEDSRDARPATDLDFGSEDGVEEVPLPVMAAAPVNREDGTDAPDDSADAIFPERESPFWSRATGRDEEADGELGVDEAVIDSPEDTTVTRPDIFTRARKKLDSTARPSARERMQHLAARARDAEAGREQAAETSSDDTAPKTGSSNVLDLTDTVDLGAQTEDALSPPTGSLADDPTVDEDGAEERSAASLEDFVEDDDASAESPSLDDDVFDLTTPLPDDVEAVDTGLVESGETFHVSDVEAGRGDIADEISRTLSEEDEAVAVWEDETPDRAEAVEPVAANTYSRFDNEPVHAEEPDEEAGSEEEEEPEEVVEERADSSDLDALSESYGAAFTMPHDADDTGDVHEEDRADDLREEDRAEAVPEETPVNDTAIDAFALDEGEDEDAEPFGFTDTFGASDVYHDEPPELDEDYSRSLEVEDEPVAAQAAYADPAPERDEMETVGGMVRDAMERDPVDYADPAALVSMTSEEISARALASLADIEGEASRRMYGSMNISENGESESIEGMVRGMLRPMLREWLDDNLPSMVESAVRGEVERISAKSRRYSRASDDD